MKNWTNKFGAVLAGMAAGFVFLAPAVSVAQDYFQASGIPVQRSAISSAEFRTEFSNIETNLSDKLPVYTGNGDNWVVVNAGGTALTSITNAAAQTLLLAGGLDLDDNINLRFGTGNDIVFDFNATNFVTVGTGAWNISGFSNISAAAVDVDFDAITATSYGGIVEANLVDSAGAFHDGFSDFVAGEHLIVGAINHDVLLNFVAADHLDWTSDLGGTNLHANNSANGSLALSSAEVTQLANIGATTITAADWTATAALVGTNSGDQTITLTGNVTGSGTGSFAATIASDAVSMDKIQDIATDTFLGRVTAATGTVEVLTNAQAKSALDLTGTNSGDQTITLTGNVTGSGTGSFAATIANDAVTYAKMQNVVADERLLGNVSGAGGIVAELTQAQVITFLSIEAGATADQTSIVGITGNKAQFDTAVSDGNVAYVGGAHHDGFSDFVGDEHIDHAGVSVTAGTGLNGGGTIAATRTINADITSESQQGIVERATLAEVNTSTDTTRYISPNVLAAATIITDNVSAAEVGYKGTPLNTKNVNYELVLTDAGKTIFKASGGAGEIITIPANSAVAFPIGTIIVILNGGGTLSLAITTDTLTQVVTGLTGTRTLADDAMATIIKVTATAWYVAGGGIS